MADRGVASRYLSELERFSPLQFAALQLLRQHVLLGSYLASITTGYHASVTSPLGPSKRIEPAVVDRGRAMDALLRPPVNPNVTWLERAAVGGL